MPPRKRKPADEQDTEIRPPEDDAPEEESAEETSSDETGDYELGDDFLADLNEDDEEEEYEDEEDEDQDDPEGEYEDDEELPEEEELEEIVHAETQEWDGLEAAEEQGEAEKTLVASAGARIGQARERITSGFDSIGGERITSGFRAVGEHLRFPLWARFLTASFVIVAAVAAATAASLLLYIGDIGDKLGSSALASEIQTDLETVDGGAPQTIMILGSDKDPELKDVQTGSRGLSDTTMLLRVDPDRGAIALFSLPRDLKVDIPGYGTAKLNEAYFAGGPALTLKTVKRLTGLEVNHLVNVDFEGFARAVNAIGCVYIDVDRRYFNSNEGKPDALAYEEIDLQPGYQALCGFDALDYARYRHTDNDVVRAARQQDFLREARQKVPPEVVFAERRELIDIFTEHTTSDIDSASEMLQILKLFIEARDAEVKEVHFEGTLGPSFVTATQSEIDKAVNQFLGIESTPGPPGDSAAPEEPVEEEVAPDDIGATPATPDAPKKKKKGKGGKKGGSGGTSGPAELIETEFGRGLAKGLRARRVKGFELYYPTVLEVGTDFAQKPRVYKINGNNREEGSGAPPDGQRQAYKWVLSRPALGEYYGFMGTKWRDPAILKNPSDTMELEDGRELLLFYDGDRLRTVGWKTDNGSFWISNTLIQSLSDREMVEIAKGMTELPPRGA